MQKAKMQNNNYYEKLINKVLLAILVASFAVTMGLFMQSCSGEEEFTTPIFVGNKNVSLLQIETSESGECKDFLFEVDILMKKFNEYTNTLSEEDYAELMYNLNNEGYMLSIIEKAKISMELELVASKAVAFRDKTRFLELNETEQIDLFGSMAQKEISSPRLKNENENESQYQKCQRQYETDLYWATGIYTLALAGCTCAAATGVGMPAACFCLAAAMANYGNSLRLADVARNQCMER